MVLVIPRHRQRGKKGLEPTASGTETVSLLITMTSRAPKQWALTKTETVTSFENWKQNLQYIMSLDPNFAPFLQSTASWKKKTKSDANRGFQDDSADEVADASKRKTAAQKVSQLELMLGQIANYCPVISNQDIRVFHLTILCQIFPMSINAYVRATVV